MATLEMEKAIWEAAIAELWQAKEKQLSGSLAVAVVETVVSHVPWKISRMSSPFSCHMSKKVVNRLTSKSTVPMACADGTNVFLIDSS